MDDVEQSRRICLIAAGTFAIFPPSTGAVLVFWIANDLAPPGGTLRERIWVALRGLSKLPSPRRMAAGSQAIPPFRARPHLSLRRLASNLREFKKHYPNWSITRGLQSILSEMIALERERQNTAIAG